MSYVEIRVVGGRGSRGRGGGREEKGEVGNEGMSGSG